MATSEERRVLPELADFRQSLPLFGQWSCFRPLTQSHLQGATACREKVGLGGQNG